MSATNFQVPRARPDNGGAPAPPTGSSSHQEFQLTSSAPVSSLLPPIPSTQQQQHHGGGNSNNTNLANPALHAQIAALLAQQGRHPNLHPGAHQALQQAAHFHNANNNNAVQSQQQHQLLAATAAAVTNPLFSTANMQNWSLEQLEKHVHLLNQLNQHVPQNVSILLHEAKKRAQKRHAKRVANRKSASTSRARKKALVQEMTALNTRLRRQALILSLLPDLVMVINLEGKITFCSAQVERVLGHNIDDLIGAQLADIVVPESRGKLGNLIQELLGAGRGSADSANDKAQAEVEKQDEEPQRQDAADKSPKKKAKKSKKISINEVSAETSKDMSAKTVTDTSFPLSVVKVDPSAGAPGSSDENENSDTSASNGKQPSSLTNSSLGNSDDSAAKDGRAATTTKKNARSKEQPSSDSSNTSSTVSADANNLLSANANLARNVRWHNKKMKDKAVAALLRAGYKDDVTGATVTANNATARLSSLQHLPGSSSSEEDSGYRESNDSREETSSSEGDEMLGSNGRRKPIAPTCNVCLIRNDLTTIWCEATSSIRTKDTEDESVASASWSKGSKKPAPAPPADGDMLPPPAAPEASVPTPFEDTGENKLAGSKRAREDSSLQNTDVAIDGKQNKGFQEILLCLRPIRDGDKKTDEAHRFKPNNSKRVVSEDNTGPGSSSEETSSSPKDAVSGKTLQEAKKEEAKLASGKKRDHSRKDESAAKRQRSTDTEETVDSAVVASLMSMSNQK